MENDLLRMKLQAFVAGYPDELDGHNDGLSVPSEMDRIVPYGGWRIDPAITVHRPDRQT